MSVFLEALGLKLKLLECCKILTRYGKNQAINCRFYIRFSMQIRIFTALIL